LVGAASGAAGQARARTTSRIGKDRFATVTWSATGQTLSNSATVATSGGQVKAYASRATHVIIDVVGFVTD
jgi:hypothetical protein